MQPPRPARLAQRTDKGLLDMCGWVPISGQLDWLRVETDSTFLGVGIGLPEKYRGSVIYEGVDLTQEGRSRWFDHVAHAMEGGAAVVVSLGVGALIATGRGAGWPSRGCNMVTAGASVRRVFLASLAALVPPVLFYFGYNRLHLGAYGLGSFAPPAWAIWPALVFAGLLAGWAWTRCSVAAIRLNWESTARPARCPTCEYAWNDRNCTECGSSWTPDVLRRSRVRSTSRVVTSLVLVAALAVAAPQLSPLVLARGPWSAKMQFLVRWLVMRPTNYSVGDGFFVPGAW